MLLRRIDKPLPVALLREETRRKPSEKTRQLACKIHPCEQPCKSTLTLKCGDRTSGDESLLREVNHAPRHLLSVQKAVLAEFTPHARRKLGKFLEDGLKALHAAEIREDTSKGRSLNGRIG